MFQCPHCPVSYLLKLAINKHIEKFHYEETITNGLESVKQDFKCGVKKEEPVDDQLESADEEDGIAWPPLKGSMVATLFDDAYYIGKVVNTFNADGIYICHTWFHSVYDGIYICHAKLF